MHDIVKYLKAGELPENEKHAHKVCIQSARFTLINERLYRRSFGGPYLRCLSDPKAKYVLAELHKGVPSIPRVPSEVLNPVINPWLFTQWGWIQSAPYPLQQHKKKFMLVATEYFSKDNGVSKFFWKNIVCRFGVHKRL
ncbi:hypothetical protein CK203_052342 [Vitis vinifera]|uniref:Uncharacterized protein n=1 Tax=Vitis vinifera TaxID=29760 RepID=A0A438H3T7_VITVI|nr:hypothetical protein CK203_052342 [Vitis vinifera]